MAVRPEVEGVWGGEWDRAVAMVAAADLRRGREGTACAPSAGNPCRTGAGSRASRSRARIVGRP